MKDLKILEENENKLFNRLELYVEINHEQSPTPTRKEIKSKIAALKGVNENLVIVDSIKTSFGFPVSYVRIRIYKDENDLKKLEPKYLIKRNTFEEEQKEES